MTSRRSVFGVPAELERAEGRIADLEKDVIIDYAEKAIANLEAQGKVIKDKPKEIKKLVALKTRAEREARLEDIRLNYADDKRRTETAWLEAIKMPDAAEILRYGEEHSIDISTDAGLKKCVLAMASAQTAA